MPSSGASWQICRRLRAAPLDKEEPRKSIPRTQVKKGKSEGPRPLSKEPRPHTLAYRLILNVPRRR
jgi:hypothetical protein